MFSTTKLTATPECEKKLVRRILVTFYAREKRISIKEWPTKDKVSKEQDKDKDDEKDKDKEEEEDKWEEDCFLYQYPVKK